MKLAVLCPSRGRPELARKMQDSFGDVDVFFYLNDDDPELENYDVKRKMVGPDAPIAYSSNLLWMRTPGYDAYMFCGDDAVCKSDNLVETLGQRSSAHADGIWMAGVNDGREEGSFPHPIVSVKWTHKLGYFVPPMFFHWYIDTYLERLALRLNRFIDMSEILVEHQTPKTGKNPMDETFRRIRRGLWRERDAYVASHMQYFDADLARLS